MLSLLWNFLVGGCFGHKWAEYRKINVFEDGYTSRPYCTKYILRCEKCGKMKKKVF